MKYRYTILIGILSGSIMSILWSLCFINTLGPAGSGVGIVLGFTFACCGCLIGYSIDRKGKGG